MRIHEEVLRAALDVCDEDGVFRLRDVLAALPHLNQRSVGTHVSSRCCLNAPKNHPHKWDYFRRVSHGVYQIAKPYRRVPPARVPHGRVPPRRDVIHVTVTQEGDTYVAECLELPVVTEARSIDRLVANLEEAIDLHLQGEDRVALGLADKLKIALSTEVAFERD